MAQPQGLNVPAIILTGITAVILIATTVEGVRAYYNYTLRNEEAAKWTQGAMPLAEEVRAAQELTIKGEGRLPIGAAMQQVVATKGKMPATKPSAQ
ncbi:MAG TPA: hypothetical protein VF624_14250 [Tepidisphaeraceae bacterium]|jgi:hypothetical protein